jgi:hypothetical protein
MTLRVLVFVVLWAPGLAGPTAYTQAPSAPNPYRALDTWPQLPAGMELGQVSGVELDARGNVWESNAERNPGWTPGIRVGNAADGSVTANIPAMSTERAVADKAGNLYAAVLAGRTVRKYVQGN